MDAITTDALPPQQVTDWDVTVAEANAWRGACLHHCSAVESAVTETLLTLSASPSGGAHVQLRHLVGQRLEDLAAAIAPEGPFGEIGKAAYRELQLYRDKHAEFRKMLCHGVMKIAVERNGRWILVIKTLALRAGEAERHSLALDKGEAQKKLDALKLDGGKLNSLLGQLRKALTG